MKLEKLSGPALGTEALGNIDAVLLSHDQHADNLDHSGKDFLPKARRVLTTVAGAKRLGGHAEGLAPWATIELTGRTAHADDHCDTGAPRPGRIEPLAGDVIGFVVTQQADSRPIYISGDTVWYDGVAEVARRFKPAWCCPSPAPRRPAAISSHHGYQRHHRDRARSRCRDHSLHTDGWAHFRQNASDLRASFDTLGFGARLKLLEPGVATLIEMPHALA